MAIGQTADELEKLDQQACPVCGITFYEFRSQGRLGCPNDYVCFRSTEPLILNIHGESEHVGKSPKGLCRQPCADQLIRLRREIKAAIAEEAYERALAAPRPDSADRGRAGVLHGRGGMTYRCPP